MLNRLIEFSLRQRALIVLLTVMLSGLGLMAWRSLPIDAFPDVSGTQVKLIIKAPGLTPEEIESRITVPIEQELLGIPQQKMLRSTSKYALADITLDFEDRTDVYWARQQVSERLAGVMSSLPANATGGLAPITTPLGEMYMFTIEGPQSLEERRRVLDWVVRPALRSLPGVADVNSLGGRVRTFEVAPDPLALQARGVSLRMLEEAVRQSNQNDGAGRLNAGEEALIVRAEGAIQTLDDLKNTVVQQKDGRITRVADIATVRYGELTRYGSVTRDGQGETVEGLVLGLRGANARELVQGVSKKLDELQPALPKGMQIQTFYNRANLVDKAVHTVGKALFEAIVLVVVLLLAFLGQIRAATVVAVMLPLSALGTFMLMKWFGLSANLMSLGGLAIAIGMLVDGAVVVVENIESHLAKPHAGDHTPSMLQLIYRASQEVAMPVVSGIAIIVIVFLPLLSLEGLEGKLFAPVALTIVFALSVSLILSLTVVPVLASWLLKAGHHQEPWLMRQIQGRYESLLDRALRHPKWMFSGAGVALVLAAVLFTMLGKTFMPTLDEGDLILQLEKLPSINLATTTDLDTRVQQHLRAKVPEVAHVIARSGSDELGLDPMGLNQTDSFLTLKPIEQWRQPDKEWLIGELRQAMEDFPGVDIAFTQPIDMRVSEMLTGVRGDVAIKIYGTDLTKLNELARQAEAIIAKVPGATDTLSLRNDGVQYLKIGIDRQAAGQLGLNAQDIQADLKKWVEGETIGLIQEEGRRTPLVIRGDASLRDNPAAFKALQVASTTGESVPLQTVVRMDHVDGPVKIDRERAQRYVVIQTNVRGRDLVSFVNDAKTVLAKQMPLPTGYSITWGGQFENQQRATQRLAIVIPIALFLIFFLLFSTFGSVRQAALVMSNVPLALIGGIAALFISGQYLSVPASVGFIALLGIAVLNGVVMVSYFNQLVLDGYSAIEAVRLGAARRLRPVLMTAAITAGGLVPLLFATGPGSEIQKPLAIVVSGGLLTSTILTLLLLPLAYARFGVEPSSTESAA
ncbi:MAG TPA: CusA/CzcA family heavy metal efflux RND transporter [Aquabacterium sp.]|nr:CusA/CzcA family heavy metal efflux RND transporter [Aquabacterium sp.]